MILTILVILVIIIIILILIKSHIHLCVADIGVLRVEVRGSVSRPGQFVIATPNLNKIWEHIC